MDIQIQIPQGVDLGAELNQALSVAREQQSVSLDLSASREFKPLNHLEEFEARFPQVFRLFESLGIHPEKPAVMFDPYAK